MNPYWHAPARQLGHGGQIAWLLRVDGINDLTFAALSVYAREVAWKFWGNRQPELPFTPEQYELVRDLFRSLILDPDYGSGTHDDAKQRRILDALPSEGLISSIGC